MKPDKLIESFGGCLFEGDFVRRYKELYGKSPTNAKNVLSMVLAENVTNESKEKVADHCADFVLKNALWNLILEKDDLLAREIGILRFYQGRVDFSNIPFNYVEGQVYSKNEKTFKKVVKGKRSLDVRLRWAAPSEITKTPTEVQGELAELGIEIKGETDEEILISLEKEYKTAKNNLNYSVSENERKFYTERIDLFLRLKSEIVGSKKTLKEVQSELAELGIEINGETDEEILISLEKEYNSKLGALKKSVRDFEQRLSAEQNDVLANIRAELRSEFVLAMDQYHKDKYLKKITDKMQNKIRKLSKTNRELLVYVHLEGNIVKLANDIADLKKGKYQNATQFQNDALNSFLSGIGKILVRGNVNRSSAREIIADIAEFYKKDNQMLEGFYDEGIGELIDDFAKMKDTRGQLTVDELRAVRKILTHIKYVVSNYSKIYRKGQYVDARETVAKYMEIAKDAKENISGTTRMFLSDASRMFMDPASVFLAADGYNENGFFTNMYNDLVDGLIEQQKAKKDLMARYDAFMKDKKNKKYRDELLNGKDLFDMGDKKIPKKIAIALYMTSKTQGGMDTIRETGWKYRDEKGRDIKMPPIANDNLDFMYDKFSEQDKELISILEEGYKKSGELKAITDMKRLGMTNVMEGYYYPLWRDVSKSVDTNDVPREMERVSNLGFNKSRNGSKTVLIIDGVVETFERHANAVSKYYGLSIPVANINVLFNMDVFGNSNIDYSGDFEADLTQKIHARNPESLKSVYGTFLPVMDKYVQKLVADVQGIKTSDEGNRLIAKGRSKYATFQLGLNLKVLLTQTSSYLASLSILSPASLVKGFAVKVGIRNGETKAKWLERAGNEVDKYCTLAELRDYDGSVVKAMSVSEKASGWTMKGVGVMDRMVVIRLFGACQAEAASKNGLEIGTEENKVKAGKILREVILKTQQNSLQTEWSEAMRSNSEIIKGFTMFGADSMKMLSRVIDTVGRIVTLKKKISNAKKSGNTELVKTLKEELKKAEKQCARQVRTMVSVAVWAVLIAELFRFFYNKDDEDDKTFAERFAPDVMANMLGMVPVVRDITSFFYDGYEINGFAYSMLNETLNAFNSVMDLSSAYASGEPVTKSDLAKALRKVSYAAGQFTGLPTRNVYNFVTGMIRRFDEGTGYKIDSLFYNASYKKDLAKAIEEGNDDLAISITEMLMAGNGDYSSKTVQTIAKLYGEGYDCLPRQVSDTATVNGVSYQLDAKQYATLKDVYGEANNEVEDMISSKLFGSSTNEVRAKAINYVYDTYYQMALSEALGVDIENKMILFSSAFDISELAIIIARCRSIIGDVDENGKTISGSRKAKLTAFIESLKLTAAQKYMIMGYLGYKNTKGEAVVRKYIQSLKLTKEQKEELFEKSGYELK